MPGSNTFTGMRGGFTDLYIVDVASAYDELAFLATFITGNVVSALAETGA